MTILWLIVWLLSGTPHVANGNAWMIALIVCLAIDLFGGRTIWLRR